MKLNRSAAVVGLLAAALLLSGCGSDNNDQAGRAPARARAARRGQRRGCAGKKTLKASGSTAQANAMTRFIAAYRGRLPGLLAGLHVQRLRCRRDRSSPATRPTSAAPTPRSTPDKGEVDAAKTALRLRRLEPAGRLRTDRGHLQRAGRRQAGPRRPHHREDLQRRHHRRGTTRPSPTLNPGVTLPVRRRSTWSTAATSPAPPTTSRSTWTSASDGAWGKGAGKTFNGGVGEGAKGNEGTSAAIKSTEGSITYNEWSFATAQNLTIASIVTSAGPDPVEISTGDGGQDHRGRQGQGHRQRPGAGHLDRSTSRPRPAPTRSCWPPTRSSARSTPTPTPARPSSPSCTTTIGAGQDGLADNGYIPIPDTVQDEADHRDRTPSQ